jgi:predicted O-methyltransferase YrrM
VTALDRLYIHHLKKPSDVREHLPVFVNMVKRLPATRVIELGVRSGVSTVAWLYALRGCGQLWSVDVNRPPTMGRLCAVAECPWTFVRGRDDEQAVLDALPQEVDIVFIDTSHTYWQTHIELVLYSARVRKGGRILLHDTELRRPAMSHENIDFPVRKAMIEFAERQRLKWVNKTNCNGLGIIEI